MKKHTFNSREEVIKFLDKHNLKYYVPRLREYMSNIKDEFKHYYIVLDDSNEVKYCGIISITGGEEFEENFFDIDKVIEYKDTAYNRQYREKKYKEGIENGYF